nr:hypothetical protein Iba_chr01dCG14500 [Ipomoea batatas]
MPTNFLLLKTPTDACRETDQLTAGDDQLPHERANVTEGSENSSPKMLRAVISSFFVPFVQLWNTDIVDLLGLIDAASTANRCLYGPISLDPNFEHIRYGSLNSEAIESEDRVSVELLLFLKLILKKITNKHFTMLSEILFGLSSPDNVFVSRATEFLSSAFPRSIIFPSSWITNSIFIKLHQKFTLAYKKSD